MHRPAGPVERGQKSPVPGVLLVGDGRRPSGGGVGRQRGHGGQEGVDIGGGGRDAAAGPDGPGDGRVVAGQDLAAVGGDLGLGRQAEEADQIGVGAEAAVADADGPLGDSRAATRAWGMPSTVKVPMARVSVSRGGPRSA